MQSRIETGRVSVASENGGAAPLDQQEIKEPNQIPDLSKKGSIADFMPSLSMGFMSDMFPGF